MKTRFIVAGAFVSIMLLAPAFADVTGGNRVEGYAGGLPIKVDGSATTQPITNSNTSTKETPSCASPCSITAANTVVLAANTTRHTCSLQNIGTVPLYGCYHATVCASSAPDFVIGNPGGTSGAAAMTTSYQMGPQTVVWSGGVTFAGAVGGSLIVGCY